MVGGREGVGEGTGGMDGENVRLRERDREEGGEGEWEGDVESSREGWEGLKIGERRGIGSEEMGEGGSDKDIMTERGRGEGEVGQIGIG